MKWLFIHFQIDEKLIFFSDMKKSKWDQIKMDIVNQGCELLNKQVSAGRLLSSGLYERGL